VTKAVCHTFIGLIFLLSLCSSLWAAEPQRVLFISAYHPAFPTFFQQVEGVKSVFNEKAILLDIEFMDTKRFPGREPFDLFHRALSYKLSEIEPYDAIIVGDDNALAFALEYQHELFRETPIVFLGVNNIGLALQQNANPYITGVVEAVSMRETLELILRLHPNTQRVVALVDGLPSGQADLERFYQYREDFSTVEFAELSLAELSFDAFSEGLRALGENDVALLLSAYRDATGTTLLFHDSLELIGKNLSRPLYHLWQHGMGQGVVGGKLISHRQQGVAAAEIVMQILAGGSVESIAVSSESPNNYIFDYRELARFGINRSLLPADSEILNEPQSYYRQNRTAVWLVCGLFLSYSLLVLGMYRSMLRRKKTEKSLQESERNLKSLLTNMPIAVALLDAQNVLNFRNKRFVELFGYTREDVPTLDEWWPLAYPDAQLRRQSLETWERAVRKAVAEGTDVGVHEYSITCKDGAIRTVEISGIPLEKGMLTTFIDVTERNRAADELRSEQFRLYEIIRGTNVGTWEWNVQTGETKFNERWAEIIGYRLDELTPLSVETWMKYVHPGDLKESNSLLEKHFRGELDYYELECRMKHKDGRWVWVLTRGKMSSWTADGKPLLMFGTHTDIDERKRHEDERQVVEKLNSVGTLAGGIAHDFNNILAGLYGNISLAKRKLTKDHPGFGFLEAAEKSMRSATLLTNQLLTFAKGGEPVRESLSLGSLVEEVVSFNLSGSNVKPVISRADDLWFAKADPGQIQQVFGNLTINAKHAMPDGGHLHITMENAVIPPNTMMGLDGGDYVRITVADEGCGIEPEHLDRIFDPYFTTKQTGSGLGLASVYSIIKKHDGNISVDSQIGRGTTFTIYLPATKFQSLYPVQNEGVPAAPLETAKILVMDDEEVILGIITAMLEELDFTVETAVDGRQALEIYRQALDAGQPFDLAILDLTIPGGIGGKETARNILKIDPEARMIVSSGYADDPVMANYAQYGFKGVVTKPFTLGKLSPVVTRALHS
jgi:PAS domain S-box-containing protein